MNQYTPAFSENNIAVCLSCDDTYFSYCVVTLESIVEHANEHYNYDIIILHTELSTSLQDKLLEQSFPKNISIRFVNVDIKSIQSTYKIICFQVSSTITLAAYFRLFIPLLFSSYDKMLYLDVDLVLNKDVSELFEIELSSEQLIGAVPDLGVIGSTFINQSLRQYIVNILSVTNYEDYINSGVLLINIKQMVRENTVTQFFEFLKTSEKLRYLDQDVINKVCYGRVHFINPKWNVLATLPFYDQKWLNRLPKNKTGSCLLDIKDPYIIHYAGDLKPWRVPETFLGTYFWKIAQKTFVYEQIIYQNCITPQSAFILFNYKKIKHKHCLYSILTKITFGKKKVKYINRKKELLNKLNSVKSLFKAIRI